MQRSLIQFGRKKHTHSRGPPGGSKTQLTRFPRAFTVLHILSYNYRLNMTKAIHINVNIIICNKTQRKTLTQTKRLLFFIHHRLTNNSRSGTTPPSGQRGQRRLIRTRLRTLRSVRPSPSPRRSGASCAPPGWRCD